MGVVSVCVCVCVRVYVCVCVFVCDLVIEKKGLYMVSCNIAGVNLEVTLSTVLGDRLSFFFSRGSLSLSISISLSLPHSLCLSVSVSHTHMYSFVHSFILSVSKSVINRLRAF